MVTITARDNWTKEEYLEAIAAAECGNDYLSWDYIENADGTEVWTFEYHCSELHSPPLADDGLPGGRPWNSSAESSSACSSPVSCSLSAVPCRTADPGDDTSDRIVTRTRAGSQRLSHRTTPLVAMMDDPDQGTYTFTGAQLKEQRRQWMDEGRRSALAEQALIEHLPPRPPFKVRATGLRHHAAGHCTVLDVRASYRQSTTPTLIDIEVNAQPAKDGGWDYAGFVALSDYKPSSARESTSTQSSSKSSRDASTCHTAACPRGWTGERFYLERVAGAPQSKAWYLIGGSAFQHGNGWLDRGEMDDPTAAFLLAWNQQCEKELVGVDIATVRAGGKATKEWPNKEDQAWWFAPRPDHGGPVCLLA